MKINTTLSRILDRRITDWDSYDWRVFWRTAHWRYIFNLPYKEFIALPECHWKTLTPPCLSRNLPPQQL